MRRGEESESSVAPFPVVDPRANEAEALAAVIRRLNSARTLAEVMDVTTHAARTLLGADGVSFVLRDGDLCHYADEDAIAPLWKGCRFPISECISGWCMTEGKSVAIGDIRKDPRIPQDAYLPTFVRSLAMAPVRQQEPVAAVGAYWARRHLATAEELDRLQTLANAAALAMATVEHESFAAGAAGVENDFQVEAGLAQSVLDSLTSSVAVTDEVGRIVAVNAAWRNFALSNGSRESSAFIGQNYLDVCISARGPDAECARSAAQGLAAVLSGETDEFRLEYPCHSPDEQRWFELRATRFDQDGRRFAVVAHEDVTNRRLSEEKYREHSAMLDALLEHVPEGITIASAPEVVIDRVSAHGLRKIQRLEADVAHIAANLHPEAWQIYDAGCTRMVSTDELPLTRATRHGEVIENEELCLRLPDGGFLPILCNAGPIRDGDGIITGGVIAWRDITDRKRADEARQLLVRELNHRVKNLFSIMLGMIRLSARDAASVEQLAHALTGRLRALAKAHELIRPAVAMETEAPFEGSLTELIRGVVGAHADRSAQLCLAGPDIAIGPDASVNLALLFHELATNASKYGALSTSRGSVAVDWIDEDGKVRLTWAESGGPAVAGQPDRLGFGSELARRCVRGPLAGSIAYHWLPEGLRVELKLPRARLVV